jgi:acetyl esterase/lipase
VSIRRSSATLLLLGVLVVGCSTASSPPVASPSARTSSPAPTEGPTAEPTPRPLPTAGAFPSSVVAGLQTETDVPFTTALPCAAGECEVPLDILAPETGEALPTIVLLPGGPTSFTNRRYVENLAAGLAQRGAVVFLATYRSIDTGNSIEGSMHDVRCAVRYARSRTGDYGGDPERLVLVGHSYGSALALQTGVNGEAATAGCLADENGMPDAVVGLAGFLLDLSAVATSGPPLLLVSGSEDRAAAIGQGVADELSGAGFEAAYVELEGIDHPRIVEPADAPHVIDLILDAASP